MIVPPNGQHSYVRPDRHGYTPPITAPAFHRTDEGPYVVPNANNSVQSHVQGRDGHPVLVYHPAGTTVTFDEHGVLVLLSTGRTGVIPPVAQLQHQIGSGGNLYGCPSFAATTDEVASFAWACMDQGIDVMEHLIPVQIEPNLYVSGNVPAEYQADLRSFCLNSRLCAAREEDAQAGLGGPSGTTVRTPEGDRIIVRHPAGSAVRFLHDGSMVLVFSSPNDNENGLGFVDGGAQGRLVRGGTVISTNIAGGNIPSRTEGLSTIGEASRQRIDRSKIPKPKRRDTMYRLQTGMVSPTRAIQPRPQSTPHRPVFGPPRPPLSAVANAPRLLPTQTLGAQLRASIPSNTAAPLQASTSSSSSSSNIVKDLSKLEPFDGTQESFKKFETNLKRVAAVNDLEHTLDPDYWGSSLFNVRDNKIMYFLLEKAVKDNVLAYSHFKKAPEQDGNRAYFALREAYVFSGQAHGAILLMQLTNFRLGQGELVSAFCLRLRELFEDLEGLEGEHAFIFNDTQRLGYLLTAIRNEDELEASYTYITSEMNRGTMTFELAVTDLESRCEQSRADDLLNQSRPRSRRHGHLGQRGSSRHDSDSEDFNKDDTPRDANGDDDHHDRRAFVSTQNKRHNQSRHSGGGRIATPPEAPDASSRDVLSCAIYPFANYTIHPSCVGNIPRLNCGMVTDLSPMTKPREEQCILTAFQPVCWKESNDGVAQNPKATVSGAADKELRLVWMPLLPALRGILYTRPTWTAERDKP